MSHETGSVRDGDEELARIVAGRSHEIRTPMNAIIGMAEVLWESPLTPAQREYVQIIRETGDTLLDLIDGLTGGVEVPVVGSVGTPADTMHDEERPLRILIADDALDNRVLFQLYLRESPHQVDIVENGQSAVEKFASGAFDLVLMDVEMPVLDGNAAVRAIRDHERTHGLRRTPIIALTAHTLPEEVEKSRQAGCDAHLTKPVRKGALLEAINGYAHEEEPGHVVAPPALLLPAGGDDARIVVQADPDLVDLMPEYLERRRQDLGTMTEALDQDDYETIRVLGHSMRGSGAAYGFDGLADIGQTLEQAAQGRQAGEIRGALDELARYLRRVEVQNSSP